jgi:beta-phosphoglucomutase-like phosphatase (HAD superfamily)
LVEFALADETASCLAIEDSNTGAKSADPAGCIVLVVPNQVPVLDGPRRVFVDGRGSTVPPNSEQRIGVTLSEELQLHPEQSTDAFVLHHPEAKYFNV